MAPRFDAIGLTVADMSATLDFYRALGLEVPADADGESHVEAPLPGGLRLMFDTVELVQSFSEYEPPRGGHRVSLAFLCGSPSEVDETYATMVEAGHQGRTPPFDAFWGQRYATIADPDGNPVDLFAALPG